jgi:hypothetical protein
MKKIIAMAIAVVMIAALAATGVSAEGRYVWNHTGAVNGADPFSDTTRVGHQDALDATVRFKVDVSFSKILFPQVWAFAHSVITFELINGGKTVYTGTYEFYNAENGSGDLPNVELDFGKKLPAGEYTLRISTDEAANYAFFAFGEGPLSEEYIEFERGHMMFGLYTEDNGQGFVTFATEVGGGDVEEPGENPGSGDAAIVAIAAVAAVSLGAVVLLKKRG